MKSRGRLRPPRAAAVTLIAIHRAMCLMLGLGLTGCIGRSDHAERTDLSARVVAHTGYGLRTNALDTLNQLPPGVKSLTELSEEEAVAIALWNNAAFQQTLSKLGLARGDLAQAGLLANPTFSMLFPIGPKQLEFTAAFPLEALWLRPKRIALAQVEAERVASGLVQSGLDLVRDVRAAVSDLSLARDRERLSHEVLTVHERIAEVSQARERAGEGSELEAVAARADAARAAVESRRLEQEGLLARERLVLLLGWTSGSNHLDFATASSASVLELSTADWERTALASRPDLRAAELGLESAARRAGLARAEIFMLSGLIDANASGKQGFEIGPGMQLPIPIFNQNQAGRTRAQAEVERAAWNYAETRQRILLEVREAQTKAEAAHEALRGFEQEVLPALEELEQASQRAMSLGELSPLAVYQSTKQLLAARVRQAELEADLRRARAELERSVGTRLQPNFVSTNLP